MRLVLKDGKFYRGNEIVPPEFGNLEMIRLIKEAEQREENAEKAIEGSFTCEEQTTYSVSVKFTCSCGHKNIEDLDESFEDYEPEGSDVEDYYVECSKCKQEYRIQAHNEKEYMKDSQGRVLWNTKKILFVPEP